MIVLGCAPSDKRIACSRARRRARKTAVQLSKNTATSNAQSDVAKVMVERA